MATKPNKTLFTLSTPSSYSSTGKATVTCTEPRPKVYLLTFSSPPDNRLASPFCTTLLLAFDILHHRYPPGVIITTSAIEKFYSNGMDIEHSQITRMYFPDVLYRLWKRVLTYPMPVVALVNGHAFAGGAMLVGMHDYRIMNPHRGYICLNELELGMPMPPAMLGVFKEKLSGATFRKLVLEAHRYKALEALEDGLVDSVGGLDEALAFIEEFQLVKKAQPGASGRSVYGELKREMWRKTVEYLDDAVGESRRLETVREGRKREEERSLKNVESWERARAKL
ncbi:unnamed protein product [Zymoseptoria tritici ST99CH_1E4]|uniref:Enoyl-CoA hydratase n=1 Tax=Zymoseptoria tritici ST99CH_1E4 TaxID=1276532 RepID=A0A2H1G4M4_ZYMTR|nr:unnamed protein product [Zymoseptoria tritici ST99CH_1E4]